MESVDALVLAAAACFLVLGLVALVAPLRIYQTFRIVDAGAEARNEARAVYGGMSLAIAGVLAVAPSLDEPMSDGVLIAVAAAAGGMAVGRLLSRLIEPAGGFYPVWFWFSVEVATATALVIAAIG